MSNFDVTEIGAIRVRLRRFLDDLNGTGQKLNFGLFFFHFFSFSDYSNIFPLLFLNFPPKITPNRVPLILLL